MYFELNFPLNYINIIIIVLKYTICVHVIIIGIHKSYFYLAFINHLLKNNIYKFIIT